MDGSQVPEVTLVIPCYNEQEVLGETARRLGELLVGLMERNKVALTSGVWFIDDGSKDRTWKVIEQLASKHSFIRGMKLAHNRGHQNALLAGLLTVPGDVLISVDADLQDDLGAIEAMLDANAGGADIVYGVRRRRDKDTLFKRFTAEAYYALLGAMGVEIVFNHADYRLMSRRTVEALREYGEVNLFLRGIIPQLGFPASVVYYDRAERFAGQSKYPLSKMLSFAIQGITSFSAAPLRWITMLGLTISAASFGLIFWVLWVRIFHTADAVPGWASTVTPVYFLGGIQLLSMGIIGEYLAKIYLETKRRPRFTIDTVIGGPAGLTSPAQGRRRDQSVNDATL